MSERSSQSREKHMEFYRSIGLHKALRKNTAPCESSKSPYIKNLVYVKYCSYCILKNVHVTKIKHTINPMTIIPNLVQAHETCRGTKLLGIPNRSSKYHI